MKTVLIVGSTLLWLGYIAATAAIGLVSRGEGDERLLAISTFSSTIVVTVVGPIVGLLVANVADPTTTPGRRYYRRLAWSLAVTLVISASLTITDAVLQQAPAWAPVARIALTVACSIAPIAAAERYRRRLDPTAYVGPDQPMDAASRHRTYRAMAIVFLLATAIALALAAILAGGELTLLHLVGFPLIFGAFAASVPALRGAHRASASINRIFGTDIETRRRVGRTVLGKGRGDLTEDDASKASLLAQRMVHLMPLQAAQSGLIVVAAIANLALLTLDSELAPFLLITIGVLVPLFVAAVIANRIQFGRYRRYADAHPIMPRGPSA